MNKPFFLRKYAKTKNGSTVEILDEMDVDNIKYLFIKFKYGAVDCRPASELNREETKEIK